MNTAEFKEKLLAEKKKLEGELAHLGIKEHGDWEATGADLGEEGAAGPGREADPQDAATDIEAFEERNAVEVNLEKRLTEVDAALERIQKGTYGKCSYGNDHEIGEDLRRENPAAIPSIRQT